MANLNGLTTLTSKTLFLSSSHTATNGKKTNKEDLVVLTRQELESLLDKNNPTKFTLTKEQKQKLAKAEDNFNGGKTLSYALLKQKLALGD